MFVTRPTADRALVYALPAALFVAILASTCARDTVGSILAGLAALFLASALVAALRIGRAVLVALAVTGALTMAFVIALLVTSLVSQGLAAGSAYADGEIGVFLFPPLVVGACVFAIAFAAGRLNERADLREGLGTSIEIMQPLHDSRVILLGDHLPEDLAAGALVERRIGPALRVASCSESTAVLVPAA